jgi:hypothetical protein
MGAAQNKKSGAFLFGLFGAYLLAGAGYSFFTAMWFPGFPPQLDISMLFGSIGVYIEATLASIIGVACLYLAIVGGRKHAA